MIELIDIRDCLDGGFPSFIATSAADGTPNLSVLSDVRLIDERHVALSFQFFNKTRANILINPLARLHVTDPHTGSRYQLIIRYERTETSGPLFEAMKARLAGIASYSGMSKVFRLRGADVYVVLGIEQLSGVNVRRGRGRRLLRGLRQALPQLETAVDLTTLFDAMMMALDEDLGFRHSMLLLTDDERKCLFTVASRGYAQSGVGSEIAFGEGIVGIAAAEQTPIRIPHMAQEYLYSEVVRERFLASNPGLDLECRIPLPGLPESRSQLAMPMFNAERLLGVIYVESPIDGNITQDDEDALAVLAASFATRYRQLATDEPRSDDEPALNIAGDGTSGTLNVQHHARDHSVFVNGEYLIKGVAGAVLWRLLCEYRDHQRVLFSNRELRRDPSLGLPDIADNLEARLVLLQRRLRERLPEIALERVGRGRYELRVVGSIRLEEAGT